MKTLQEVPESVKDLLRMSRGSMEMFESTQKQLIKRLLCRTRLGATRRTAGEYRRGRTYHGSDLGSGNRRSAPLSSIADAVSYCGLSAAFRSSAGKQQRGPISKQRNAWLQTVLIEAAKLAPRWNPQLAALHAQQLKRGHANRATLQVARKLVAYLLAVDKSGQPFQLTHSASACKHHDEVQQRERKKGSSFSASSLKGNTPPAGTLLTVRVDENRTCHCKFS